MLPTHGPEVDKAPKTEEGVASLPLEAYPSPPTSSFSNRAFSQHSQEDAASDRSVGSTRGPKSSLKESSSSPSRDDAPPSPPMSTHSSEEGTTHTSSATTPIRPSYFYPQPSDNETVGCSTSLTADDAPGIPVFEPSWEEFRDFYTFCQRIDEWGMKSGIVKIIPPKEWVDALPRLDGRYTPGSAAGSRYTEENILSQVRIKNSIEQIFTPAGSGSWRQSNVVHPGRIVNAKQWADLCAQDGQKGPEMSRMKENAKRGEDDGPEDDGVRTRSGRGSRVVGKDAASASPSRPAPVKRKREEGQEAVADITTEDMPALEEAAESSKTKLKLADRTTQQEWNQFDYQDGWCREAGEKCTPADWNVNVCKAIESEYWRGLNFGKAPMYGADLKGTLFTPGTQHWNVGCLDNILTRLRLRRKLPGVTTPYLYFGMWRATFAWHVEDMDLYSINYIHFGAPKQWYAIRQSDRQRFELAMAGAFPGDSSRCRHFMRHKSYLASPAFLASAAGIKPLRLVQKAQEFVITYPYGYHSGFNLGFNCAESVNFALESWLDIGRKAGYCDCANDSVKMDVDAMLEESKEMEELERKKEERERKKEEEEKMMLSEVQRLEARRAKERERRRLRKAQLALLPPAKQGDADEGQQQHPAKKTKTNPFPCVFCPSSSEEDLVSVPYPKDDGADHSKKPARHAHRLCACFMPETWVAPNPDWRKGSSTEPKEIVMGFQGVERARWSLKCQNCEDASLAKKGAKVQCTYGKCSRTTHVSCALYLSSGWLVDMLADEAADVLEGKAKEGSSGAAAQAHDAEGEDVRIVMLCKSHNPREKEKEARRRAGILRRCVEGLVVGQAIKVRTGSGVWETIIKEVRWPEGGLDAEGEVLADEDQVLKWSRVIFDVDVVKKAEEEQRRKEEEEESLAVVEEKETDQSVDNDVVMQFKSEEAAKKEQERAAQQEAKQAQQEAKLAAKQAKEEEKRQKDAKREEKRLAREAKEKVKEEKRAVREAKAAQKMIKAEAAAVRKRLAGSSPSQQGVPQGVQQPSTASTSANASSSSGYDYIRNWRPNGPAMQPALPLLHSHGALPRTMHPMQPMHSLGWAARPHAFPGHHPVHQHGLSYHHPQQHLSQQSQQQHPTHPQHLSPQSHPQPPLHGYARPMQAVANHQFAAQYYSRPQYSPQGMPPSQANSTQGSRPTL